MENIVTESLNPATPTAGTNGATIIYKSKQRVAEDIESYETQYTKVRVKKIDYLESPAIAIYFFNMTKEVAQLQLESKLMEQTNKNKSLQSYTSTISHEFRTPIGTSLMFLEQMCRTESFNAKTQQIIDLIISQLNFLLCIVNDVLAMKLIEQG